MAGCAMLRLRMFARYQIQRGAERRLRPEDAHVLVGRAGFELGEDRAQQGVIVGEEGVLRVRLDEQVEVGRGGDLARHRIAQHAAERVRVRRRYRVRRDDALGRGDRHGPGDGRPPVVAADVEAPGPDGVGQAEHVPHEQRQRVVRDVGRARAGRVAALIGRDGAEARRAEGPQLMAPLVGRLRKSVQEDHDLAVVRPGQAHVRSPTATCAVVIAPACALAAGAAGSARSVAQAAVSSDRGGMGIPVLPAPAAGPRPRLAGGHSSR